MIKSTDHLAFPAILIKCAGLLALNQLELLQEQQGQGQTGGPRVFRWLCKRGLTRLGSSRLLPVI